MSRRSSYSVTSNSINNSHTKEEIFLQPIDQQYEKIKDLNEIDHTISSLQSIKKNLDQVIDDLDTSITNLQHYLDDDAKYLLD